MGGESGRAQSPAPSMARERLCLCARRTALDGAHERTTRQSCDELPVHFADWVLRCPMMRSHCDASSRFGLTGQVTPIPSPALVDLVGHVPGRTSGKEQQPLPAPDVLSRSGSCMPPVAPGMEPRVEVTGPPA